jgi:hypothetical protein
LVFTIALQALIAVITLRAQPLTIS